MKRLALAVLLILAAGVPLRALEALPDGVVVVTTTDHDRGDMDDRLSMPGCAVVVAPGGWALTLAEALPADADPGELIAILPGGLRRPVAIAARGQDSTGVLLKIALREHDRLPPLPLADSQHLRIGDAVWTAGNSYGSIEIDGTAIVSRGIVSGRYVIPPTSPPVRGRGGSILSDYRGPVIETDAATNDGNQGGALLDDRGRLVGLVSLGAAHQRRMGTAIPLSELIADLEASADLPIDLAAEVYPAGADPIGRSLVAAARAVRPSVVLCYAERPRGPGNPAGMPRPPPITPALPRYERERLRDQWNQYYHQQQVAYTDQAFVALVLDAEQGLLLTANSNLHGEAEHGVVLSHSDRPSLSWTVHGRHQHLDLAILRCEGPLTEGSSATLAAVPDLHLGDPIGIVGRHRDGGDFTLTAGSVSAVDRRIIPQSEHALHQTDALANYGNLGGPVVDADGELVGLLTQLGPGAPWGINSGVAMFVDSATILAVADRLVAGETVERSRTVGLGIRPRWDPDGQAMVVQRVFDGTGAAAAGLEAGDRLLAVDGRRLHEADDLSRGLMRVQEGDTVILTIERDGEERLVEVVLSAFSVEDVMPTDETEAEGTDSEPADEEPEAPAPDPAPAPPEGDLE